MLKWDVEYVMRLRQRLVAAYLEKKMYELVINSISTKVDGFFLNDELEQKK